MKSSAIALLMGLGMLCANVYADNTGSNMNNPTTTKGVNTNDTFLAMNTKKPGVVTLPDGLQYKVLTEGKGVKPTLNDTVTVHYAGTLVDGKEFDSSYKRGEPATFPVSGVIAGWTEALQLMPAGSTWELYIPSALAYGSQGAPPAIGPNETLNFNRKPDVFFTSGFHNLVFGYFSS